MSEKRASSAWPAPRTTAVKVLEAEGEIEDTSDPLPERRDDGELPNNMVRINTRERTHDGRWARFDELMEKLTAKSPEVPAPEKLQGSIGVPPPVRRTLLDASDSAVWADLRARATVLENLFQEGCSDVAQSFSGATGSHDLGGLLGGTWLTLSLLDERSVEELLQRTNVAKTAMVAAIEESRAAAAVGAWKGKNSSFGRGSFVGGSGASTDLTSQQLSRQCDELIALGRQLEQTLTIAMRLRTKEPIFRAAMQNRQALMEAQEASTVTRRCIGDIKEQLEFLNESATQNGLAMRQVIAELNAAVEMTKK